MAVTLGLLAAAVYLAIDINRSGPREVLNQFNAFQSLLTRQAAHEISSHLQEHAHDLHALAYLGSVERRDPARMQVEIDAYYQRAERLPPPAISIVDETGALIFSTGSSNASAATVSFADSDFFLSAKQNESRSTNFVSAEVHRSIETTNRFWRDRILLARPLYRSETNSGAAPPASVWAGVLVMSLDLASMLPPPGAMLGEKSDPHPVWIMDQGGTILLQSEHPEMIRENVHRISERCLQCHVSFDYAQRMLKTSHGILEYQLKSQPKKLAAFASMRFANVAWTVVVNTPYERVTDFVHRSYVKMLWLLGLIVTAMSLGSKIVHWSHLSRIRAEDETKQWQAKHHLEEKLRRAEACYRALFEQSPDGILMLDPATNLPIEFNETAHRQLGYSREEFARLRLADYVVSETSEAIPAYLANLHQEGRVRIEIRQRTKAGEIRHVEVIAQALPFADRTVCHCIYHDITAAKRDRETLSRRTAQLEALHQVSLGIAAETDPAKLFQTITAQALTLFQGTASGFFRYRPEPEALELIAQAGQDTAVEGTRLQKGEDLAGQVWETGAPLVVPDYPRWEGRVAIFKDRPCAAAMAAPIQWGDTFMGVLEIGSNTSHFFSRDDAALLDIFATEAAIALKNAGLLTQTRRDAAVKTTLLHDVNHRVKNNLMRLLEIVRLERERSPASEAGLHAALADFENRLRGMEVVHTMLSNTQWNPLSLRELIAQIVNAALSGSPIRHQIAVSIIAPEEPLWVPSEQATALALILNELTTNSVKYAFNNRERGGLEVRLSIKDRNQARPRVQLQFRDDGPGWPEAVLHGQGHAVGLHLIHASTRSPLRGELALRNERGAVAELTFQLALTNSIKQ